MAPRESWRKVFAAGPLQVSLGPVRQEPQFDNSTIERDQPRPMHWPRLVVSSCTAPVSKASRALRLAAIADPGSLTQSHKPSILDPAGEVPYAANVSVRCFRHAPSTAQGGGP